MIELQIAKPCSQSWTAMKGDDKARFCGACRKNVYDIAQMTEAEVEDLIRRTEGHFCARLYRRTDQRVMTQDCPKGVAAVRRKRTLAVTAAFGALAATLYPVAQPATMGATRVRRFTPPPVVPPSEPDVRTGEIAAPVEKEPRAFLGRVATPVAIASRGSSKR